MAASDSFNSLSTKITQLSFARTTNDRNIVQTTLDQLNSLNYKYPIVNNTSKAALLINQCCTLILPEDQESVLKCCHLIVNLINRQKIVIEGRTLTISVLWCLAALKGNITDVDVLLSLDALLRCTSGHNLIKEVLENKHLVEYAKNEKNTDTAFFALQCLEAATAAPEDSKSSQKFEIEFNCCFDIFLNCLVNNNLHTENLISLKVYNVCLRGLQNVIAQKPELLSKNLGVLLGVIKSYMLVGIPGIDFIKPQKLLPSLLSIPEPTQSPKEKGGKMMKQRKPKTQAAVLKTNKSKNWEDDQGGGYTPATSININSEDGYSSVTNRRTSDSDFSDSESGPAKLAATKGRLRQAAISLFIHTIKLIDSSVLFSYWSTFVPEAPLTNKHNLITCILKETSNRGRMIALNALLIMLSSAKFYLGQAEKGENLAFTPYSVILGLTITELHRCLSFALTSVSVPVLTLVLKCFAALVQATPYHRLNPGLITKVVRNVKPFIYHKDGTVQVTALIVLGSVLASEPLILETVEAFTKNLEEKVKKNEKKLDDGEFLDFSSDEELQETVINESEIPWLLQRCLSNLDILDCQKVSVPVKLESLQILAAMCRNYFEILLAPSFNLVTKAVDLCLSSQYTDVQLHAGKAVDFMGQALIRTTNQNLNQAVKFWQQILDNLIGLMQSDHAQLRSIACDCFGSIGGETFALLPREKQILCVTLLFTCTRDENTVKGASVRALGIFVLYPTLREDPGFVVDTAEAIHRVLQDENFNVRMKCSWALGNLSDALVMNKADDLFDEFPKNLLLKLMTISIKAATDGDKIKMNAVRALGNFLQLVDEDLLNEERFTLSVYEAIDVLVKNCVSGNNMKVRWNSCYAIGNAMKNPKLFMLDNWQEKVFNSLSELVIYFRNFKVRINAAVALATPTNRNFYTKCYQHIWLALIKALETSEIIEDFNEYKHHDNLIEQICLTLAHLITLLTKEDLALVKNCVESEQLKSQMKRVWSKVIAEKSTVLFDAYSHVTNLNQSAALSTDQKRVLTTLLNVLKQEV